MNRAKAFLSEYGHAKERVARLEAQIQEIEDHMTSLTQELSADKVQTTPKPDKIGEAVSKLSDKKLELVDAKLDAVNKMLEVEDALKQIKDERYYRLLWLRYISLWRWQDIADELCYSYRGVLKVHGRALEEVNKLI